MTPERFFERCWLWMGCCKASGYGQSSHNGHASTTHRISWELHRGPIPDGAHVLHKCDTPCCVNPDHLFLGSHQDNIADRDAKGRGRRPVNPKLNADQVRAIRQGLARGEPKKALARQFSVSPAAITKIERNLSWSHLQ